MDDGIKEWTDERTDEWSNGPYGRPSVEEYGAAAKRAKSAGFDGIEAAAGATTTHTF